MDKEQRRFEERHFIEDVGLIFEQGGHPRMAGRILGRLLVSDPPYQSMTELADSLQASKSSLSTMTRLLIQMGMVERVALPAHRRDYFQIKPGGLTELVRHTTYELSAMRQVAERGLALLQGENSETRQRLDEVRDLFAYLEEQYPALIERWEREHKPHPPKRK